MSNMTPAELAAVIAANPDIYLDDPDDLRALRSPRAPAQTEAQLQQAVFAEAERRALDDARWSLLFAIPNGEYRRKATAGRLKAMGVKAGVPDIFLPVPNASKGFCGAFIELKVKRNRPTLEQRIWMRKLSVQGYFVAVVHDDAAKVIELLSWYMEGAGE